MNKRLLDIILSQFSLPLNSFHGLNHWKSVEVIGKQLTVVATKADVTVVTLFAYFHDCRRLDEDFDPGHGERASLFVKKLFKEKILDITSGQLKSLVSACRFHSDGNAKPDNLTVSVCWDADRLDLKRVGIIPNPLLLYTNEGKRLARKQVEDD